MWHWAQEHTALLTWVMAASAVLFVGSLFVMPALLLRIPADYFVHPERPPSVWAHRGQHARLALRVGRNALGAVLIVAGLSMLVLPGQGLLTILLGVLLVDFPGKYRFEKWLVSRAKVLKALNWLRVKRGRDPLRV